ncbi:xylulokinase [Arcanobacterium phocae]|uniref:Xylulokinase n=1 Tax=Arcanobacterium phocae TaxID=131112 RepID=A0A1H2LBN9_9ACTO|nr:FGGY family carbohydrate kinase [Arcanobacterium phocae]SDU78339.1 xylulokinase [Arcanobacterium phocae]
MGVVMRELVAGVDSSTQSCKVMIRDAHTGALVRSGVAHHQTGTEVSPEVWEKALHEAIHQAGGLEDVNSLAVAGQQHGMVTLDEHGEVVRNAILWNDTRSAQDADDLISELGDGDYSVGKNRFVERTGVVPVASFTITKLRWLAREEPQSLDRTRAVCLPHDWLTWKLRNTTDLDLLATDRSDVSGTGYASSSAENYDRQLLGLALKSQECANDLILPNIGKPNEIIGTMRNGKKEICLAAGCGDNAGAALGLSTGSGEVVLSIGTSGVVSLVSDKPVKDITGAVAGFADASGRYLPLVATLNASRVVDAYANLLGVSHREFDRLALSAPPGAEGLVCIPYLEGERTPNLPHASGELYGIRNNNFSPSNVARAAIEGMLCGVSEGIHAMRSLGVDISQVTLIGGGARSEAVRRIAPIVLGMPVKVPERGEYVADGAALQAAWAYFGQKYPPVWTPRLSSEFSGTYHPFILERYRNIALSVQERKLKYFHG